MTVQLMPATFAPQRMMTVKCVLELQEHGTRFKAQFARAAFLMVTALFNDIQKMAEATKPPAWPNPS